MSNKGKTVLIGILVAFFAMAFTACPSVVNNETGESTGVMLRINGLPGHGNFTAYVLDSGTDISTFTTIIEAYNSGKFRAVGIFYSGNVFRLYGLTDMDQDDEWTGSGSMPVLLFNANGVINDDKNPMYRHAVVNFSAGNGTEHFRNFLSVIHVGIAPIFPVIGPNGNWWMGDTDTGIPAQGAAGTPGSVVTIVGGYWYINGGNTGVRAQGPQGLPGLPGSSVTIVGGYWYIDGVTTGVSAIGQQGPDGHTSVITIVGGYWHVDGVTTGVSAVGQQGADGHTQVITIVGGYWHVDGESTGVRAQGPQGLPGLPGSSVTIVGGYWYIDGVTTGVSAIGQQGADGQTPIITIVGGYWHVDGVTTGVSAVGQQGADGNTPVITIVGGYWHVDGENTGVRAQGPQGLPGLPGSSVTIVGGYWYIDGVSTGVSAVGQQGADGNTPIITIVGGYWHVDGVSTGVPAQGPAGEQGPPGVVAPVTGILLEGDGLTRLSPGIYTLSLFTNDSVVLTANVTPNNALIQTLLWDSSGFGIANITRVARNRLIWTGPYTAAEITTASLPGSATISVTAVGSGDTEVSAVIAVTIVPAPVITSITVNPSTISATRGSNQNFTTTVIGANNHPQTVTWSVDGYGSSAINENGVLTVAANETRTALTVRATSTFDTTISGTAAVTVTGAIPVLGNTLGDQLAWLQAFAESDTQYIIEISNNETVNLETVGLPTGRNNLIITLRGIGMQRQISLSENGSLFRVVNGVTLVLDERISLNGRGNNNRALVTVESGGTLIMNAGSRIANNTNTTALAAPTVGNGGGVHITNNATFIMHGGEITGNTVSHVMSTVRGGGVLVDAGGTFNMHGGTISNNTATGGGASGGGGVFVSGATGGNWRGTFIMRGGGISNNDTNRNGGGVFNAGTFYISNGGIAGNNATGAGAALYGNATRGTFDATDNFNPMGSLFTTNGNISVTNGNLW